MLWRTVCRTVIRMWCVLNGLKRAGTLVWSLTDGDRRSSFSDNTEGDKHLSHGQMLFVWRDVRVTALWWRCEALQADVRPRFVAASSHCCCCCLLFMHVRWHGTSLLFSSFSTACIISPVTYLLPLFALLCNLTLSTHFLSLSHFGNLLPLRRQEAVCGHAGKTADGHGCEEDVWAVWKHRGVHGAPRAWWYQQR